MSAPKSILLDNDFLSDMKLQAILSEFGVEGVGMYCHLLTRMNDERGSMPKAALVLLHRMIDVSKDRWTSFLAFAIVHKCLAENEVDYFIPRIVDDCKNVERKRKKWADDKRRLRKTSGGRPSETSEEEEEQEELDKKNGAAKIPIDLDGHVLMTEAQAAKLTAQVGQDCFEYIVKSAADYAKQSPGRWAKYKDHAAFLRNSLRRKQEDGTSFFKHPRDGPGFYPQWLIEKLQGK